jgi:CheY-like chemotaxis protein
MTAPSNAHALIIEDEMIIAMELEELLREIGFSSFDVAATPEEAVDHATASRPALITADVRIVGGTGIEAVRAITERLGDIPHVYVTGNVSMLRDEHAPAVVEKPINPRRFQLACASACGMAT